jgi:hypothetical protein
MHVSRVLGHRNQSRSDHVISFEGRERVIDIKMHSKYILPLQLQITNS